MSKIGMVEMLTKIGDERIEFQNLDHDLRGAQVLKDGATELRFGTRATKPTELAAGGTKRIGLVLWLDRDAVNKALGR